MKAFALIALFCGLSSMAVAQTSMPTKPDSSMKAPADPGMPFPSDPGMTTPSGKGPVVKPPATGNEEIAKTPPRNVDPAIDDATEDIDRKNRKQSEDKHQKR